MTTDEQLMQDFQQGLREAFTELFQRYRERIYGFFRRRLNDAGRAEELAQETFLAVLRGSPTPAIPSSGFSKSSASAPAE
jgi:DNA-directed RNA polymerase specialized sigma24 family protein